MSSQVTLERLEEQIAQLMPHEQLKMTYFSHVSLAKNIKLIACISEQLSTIPLDKLIVEGSLQQQCEREANELLAFCDAAAEMWEGEFDAVEDIRQIRQG